jgi:hypothetical protein
MEALTVCNYSSKGSTSGSGAHQLH